MPVAVLEDRYNYERGGIHGADFCRVGGGGIFGGANRAGRRRSDCATADDCVWRGHSLCDRGGAGIGDCDIERRGGGLRARGIFERPGGDVPGNCDHAGSAGGNRGGGLSACIGDCDCVWRGADLFGLCVPETGAAFGRRFGGGPVGNAIEDGQQLSDRAWIRELSRARSAGRVCAHVCGGGGVGGVGGWGGGGGGCWGGWRGGNCGFLGV